MVLRCTASTTTGPKYDWSHLLSKTTYDRVLPKRLAVKLRTLEVETTSPCIVHMTPCGEAKDAMTHLQFQVLLTVEMGPHENWTVKSFHSFQIFSNSWTQGDRSHKSERNAEPHAFSILFTYVFSRAPATRPLWPPGNQRCKKLPPPRRCA